MVDALAFMSKPPFPFTHTPSTPCHPLHVQIRIWIWIRDSNTWVRNLSPELSTRIQEKFMTQSFLICLHPNFHRNCIQAQACIPIRMRHTNSGLYHCVCVCSSSHLNKRQCCQQKPTCTYIPSGRDWHGGVGLTVGGTAAAVVAAAEEEMAAEICQC